MRVFIGLEIIVLILATSTFVVRYLWVPNWWRTTIGRVMVGIAGGLSAFFTMLMLNDTWQPPLFAWALLLGLLDILFITQVVLLFKAQAQVHAKVKAEDET